MDTKTGVKTNIGTQYDDIIIAQQLLTIDQFNDKIYVIGWNSSSTAVVVYQMGITEGNIERAYLLPFTVSDATAIDINDCKGKCSCWIGTSNQLGDEVSATLFNLYNLSIHACGSIN